MVANIDGKMMFRATGRSEDTPWHGLANPVDEVDCYDIEKAMVASGTNFRVKLEQLQTVESGLTVPDNYAVMREDRNTILGIVGSRFVPLQNVDAFRPFQKFLDEKLAVIETMGSLDEGRRVFGLCKIQKDNSVIVKDDEVAKYVLMAHGHDGTLAGYFGFTPIRVVCQNTLSMALGSDRSRLLKFRHTKNAKDAIESARDFMNLANEKFEATAEKYRMLTKKDFDEETLRKYVQLILKPQSVKTEEGSEEELDLLKTRTKNTIEEIIGLVHTGRGNDMPGVNGTWWAAYNGMTEYLNYQRGHTDETRLNSLWFGDGAKSNKRALELAMEMAT